MGIEFHVTVMFRNAGVARGQETVVVIVGFIIAVVATCCQAFVSFVVLRPLLL